MRQGNWQCVELTGVKQHEINNYCGSACGPVIVPVFKTGGRRAIPSPVGSTPTRFRHFSMTYRHANHSQSVQLRQSNLHGLGMSLLHLVRDYHPIDIHGGANVSVAHQFLLHGDRRTGRIEHLRYVCLML
jgi:hypothetical protein